MQRRGASRRRDWRPVARSSARICAASARGPASWSSVRRLAPLPPRRWRWSVCARRSLPAAGRLRRWRAAPRIPRPAAGSCRRRSWWSDASSRSWRPPGRRRQMMGLLWRWLPCARICTGSRLATASCETKWPTSRRRQRDWRLLCGSGTPRSSGRQRSAAARTLKGPRPLGFAARWPGSSPASPSCGRSSIASRPGRRRWSPRRIGRAPRSVATATQSLAPAWRPTTCEPTTTACGRSSLHCPAPRRTPRRCATTCARRCAVWPCCRTQCDAPRARPPSSKPWCRTFAKTSAPSVAASPSSRPPGGAAAARRPRFSTRSAAWRQSCPAVERRRTR
mmetsp:Transcript_29048/g.83367  ORF Transcript_29048/g.83367 Transcript_29048/m.83367 type:complete len:336 (-) Transcript_29048:490-1497(-)